MYLLRSKITYYRSGDFVSCPIDRGIIDVKKVWLSFSSVAEVYRPGWWKHVITLTYTILKRSVVFGHPEMYGVLPDIFMIHSISRLLITLFTIALSKCSGHTYSTFCLLLFFHVIVTWRFSCTCDLLNTVKVTVSTKLQSYIAKYHTIDTADVMNLYLNSLSSIYLVLCLTFSSVILLNYENLNSGFDVMIHDCISQF